MKAIEQPFEIKDKELPFKGIVSMLEEKLDIPFFMDATELKKAGIDVKQPLPGEFYGSRRTIAHFIEMLKTTYGVSFERKQGIIFITTKSDDDDNDKEENYIQKIIDISWCNFVKQKRIIPKSEYSKLTSSTSHGGGFGGGSSPNMGGFGGAPTEGEPKNDSKKEVKATIEITTDDLKNLQKEEYIEEEFVSAQELIFAIRELHGAWFETHGEGGSIREFKTNTGHYLLISQTKETMQKIEQFLADLKRMETAGNK